MGPLPQRRGGALGFAPLASGVWEREKERKCGALKCLYALVFWGFLTTCKTVVNGYSFGACVGRFSPRVEEGLLGQRSISTLPPLDVTLLR